MKANRHENPRGQEIPNPLQLGIVTDTEEIATTIVNLSAGGVTLTAPVTYVATIAERQEVMLRFRSEEHDWKLHVPSVVRHVGWTTGVMGVDFCDPKVLHEQLPPEMYCLFNRRRSQRVHPASDQEILVHLERTRDEFQLRPVIADISAHGLGARCVSIVCTTLQVDDRVSARFFLPGVRHQLRFDCSVRAVSRRTTGFVIGLEFLEGSDQFGRYQNSVVNYVSRRQRELLHEAL